MPKRIVLMTTGTRGDIQPFNALGLALKQAGYDVCLAAPDNYLSGITATGLEAAKCGTDFRALMDQPEIRMIISGSILTRIRHAPAVTQKWLGETVDDMVMAAKGADALLFHPKLTFATDIAEACRQKAMMCALQPFSPTADYPLFILPWRSLGRTLNRATYKIIYLARAFTAKSYNGWRKKYFGLDPLPRFTHPFAVKGNEVPVLYGVSPAIVPRPADWPPHIHITGNWFLDTQPGWTPPASLQAFLDDGPPPIYVGFGSMPLEDTHALSTMLMEALAKTELRAVIAKGWGDFDPNKTGSLPGTIHVIDAAPHEHLFPLMSAIVHHGGAGTTAAALRADKPSLICPILADQPYWGRRVHELGAGPPPLAPTHWSVKKLSATLQDLARNDGYRTTAENIAAAIAREDGCAEAVRIIEAHIGTP